MKLVLRSTLRHYLHHPWQLVLAIFGIALGVAVVAAVDIASGGAQRAFHLSMNEVTGNATHQIVSTATGVDERVYLRLRLAGVREIAPLVEGHARADGETLHLLGVDPFAESGFRDHLRHVGGGDDGMTSVDAAALLTRPAAVYLAAPTAARLGVAVGADIEVEIAGRAHRLDVLGLIGKADDPAIDGLLITDIATAQELTGNVGRLSWIDVRVEENEAGAARLRELAALLPPEVELLPAQSRGQAVDQMSAAFRTNLRAMSLLALLVGMFLVYNTMSFAVVQRRDRIARLRLLGVTRWQILALILGEALVIGLAATLCGVAGGVALGRELLALVTRTMNDLYFVVTVTTTDIPFALLARGALLGMAATLAAALLPAFEAASVTPVKGLRRSALEARSRALMPRLALAGAAALILAPLVLAASGRSLEGGFAGLFLAAIGMAALTPLLAILLSRAMGGALRPLHCSTCRLAVRGIATALSRTGIALSALMLAVATTVGVGLMIASFRGAVTDWLDAVLQADIYISAPESGTRAGTGTLDDRLAARLLALPGVSARSTTRLLSLETPQGLSRVLVLGLSPGRLPQQPLTRDTPGNARERFAAGEAVLVSESYAWRHRLAPGDRIALRTDRGMHSFDIAGIHYDYSAGEGQVLMPRTLYERWFDDRGISGIGLYLAPGTAPDAAMAAIRGEIAAAGAGARLRSNADLRRLSLEIFDRTFTVTEVLRLLAIAVAAAGMFGALMALQLERRTELAILRVVGFTPAQVFGTVTLQSLCMGAIAGSIALPAGALLALALVEIINLRSFGWSMPLLLQPEVLLTGFATATGAALVAGLYPAWTMSRALPAAALRDE